MIAFLLNTFPNLSQSKIYGFNQAMLAIELKVEDSIIELLLNTLYVDFNQINKKGDCLLTLAIKSAVCENLVLKILSRTSIYVQVKEQETLLMFAIFYQAAASVIKTIFLRNSSIVNHQNEKGETALMLALSKDSAQSTIELLIEDSDLSIRNYSGQSAQDIAIELNLSEAIIQLLSLRPHSLIKYY